MRWGVEEETGRRGWGCTSQENLAGGVIRKFSDTPNYHISYSTLRMEGQNHFLFNLYQTWGRLPHYPL